MELEFKKTLRPRSENLSYFEECNTEILRKACRLPHETSIDDSNFNDSCEDYGVVTSTPYRKKPSVTVGVTLDTEEQGTVLNQKNILSKDSNTLTNSKLLSIVDRERREDILSQKKADLLAKDEQNKKKTAPYPAQLADVLRAKDLRKQEEHLRTLNEDKALAAERRQRQEREQQKHAQRASKRDQKIRIAELQAAEDSKKKQAKQKCTEEVHKYVLQFRDVFTKICNEFQSDQSLQPFVTEARPLNITMQTLIARVNDVSQNDVDTARNICSKVNEIHRTVSEEVAKLKKQAEEKAAIKHQQSNTVQPQITQPQDLRTATSEGFNESSTVDGLSDCSNKESLQWYQDLRTIKHSNEMIFDQLLKDDTLKKYRFDCQKAVNIPVNAISPVSASHLRDKLQKLILLLSGKPVMVGDGVCVSAAQHPAGISFCKDLLAKKFVRQGASTVSSKPEAAFAIAAVIVALWQDFPDWGQLLLAHFHQECPYLVPVLWPQLEGQSNKEYYQSLGYHYNEDGEVEKQDKFLKRMSGIMRLYAAIIVTRIPRDRQNRPHPHSLGQGWRWVTSMLNLEPRPDICASLLYDFLEVVGANMSEQYGQQYRKLLHAICKGYLPRLQRVADSSGGPVVRLETYLQTILKHGCKPPQGMLPPNFW